MFLLLASLLLLPFASCVIIQREITRIPAARMTRARLTAAIEHGELLVVEGGGLGWRALDEWSLDWFAAKYPNASLDFRHEDAKSPAAMLVGADLQLGSHRELTRAYGKPWYAGWGNQVEADSVEHFQPYLSPTPSWFPEAYASQGFRTEWLYFGSHRSGAGMHTDPQCHPKWSLHVSGAKRWRIREYWRQALRGVEEGGEEEGGDVVEWRADVARGDIVLFYPQSHHATEVLSKEGSLSYTNYFVSPRDSPFVRDFIRAAQRDARLAGAYGKCYREGATLEGMTQMCAMCEQTERGDPARLEICDRPQGARVCQDLRQGRIVEMETAWDAHRGKGPKWAKPEGVRAARMTFSETSAADRKGL